MGVYNINIRADFDEADLRVDLGDIEKAIGDTLANLYGESSWAGKAPQIVNLVVNDSQYDFDSGKLIDFCDGLTTVEIEHIREGRVIQAIKEVRGRTGMGLGEAKGVVDRWRYRYL